jgi:hypothetical protein
MTRKLAPAPCPQARIPALAGRPTPVFRFDLEPLAGAARARDAAIVCPGRGRSTCGVRAWNRLPRGGEGRWCGTWLPLRKASRCAVPSLLMPTRNEDSSSAAACSRRPPTCRRIRPSRLDPSRRPTRCAKRARCTSRASCPVPTTTLSSPPIPSAACASSRSRSASTCWCMEYERNDMVEYSGEQLDGFAFTMLGWVRTKAAAASSRRSTRIDHTIFFYNPNVHPAREYELREQENIRSAQRHPSSTPTTTTIRGSPAPVAWSTNPSVASAARRAWTCVPNASRCMRTNTTSQ